MTAGLMTIPARRGKAARVRTSLKLKVTMWRSPQSVFSSQVACFCRRNPVRRMRSSTSDGYLTTGIAYAWHPHRDTWYSAPQCQINWWMPIYEIVSENAMAFHPRYFGEAVSEACHHCDNCDAGLSRPSVPTGTFSPGERVEHREWGPGLVLAAEGDRLTVLFDEYGYREMATQVVSRRHLLTPA